MTPEAERQHELDTYRVVDSLPEAAYDDIARLATLLCGAPIALVSLIDRDRQWFKARSGFAPGETRRDEAFCDHAIRSPGQLMEVPDAAHDPRFAANPLVTGDEGIRFYAGMPLVTPGGAPIGTVCVLDRVPRTLTGEQRDGLASLARLAMNLLAARHREQALARAARFAADDAAIAAAQLPDLRYRTVAVFEVQGLAQAAERRGERALERTLQELEQALEQALRPGVGDNVSRATGSAEVIAVLHGMDTADAMQALRDVVAAFAARHELRVVEAHAAANEPDERLEAIFLRAEAGLSAAKDRLA
jgi:GAF domain-containing protein